MKSKQEIQEEIKALKKLKPYGVWKDRTARTIAAAIDELEEPFDRTAPEWGELLPHDRDMRDQVQRWKECGSEEDRPAQGWGGLAK